MPIDYLQHMRTESARFAAVLRDVAPKTRVPSCPEWDAADLLWHLAEVHVFWATIVRDRLADPDLAEAVKPARPSAMPELFDLYERVTDELAAAFEEAGDETEIWTWAPDQNVGFVRRFQAHEALIHRVDAELTAGRLSALPTELAADGIDVVLRYSKTWRPGWADWARSGAVGALQSTDTGGRWRVALGVWSGHSPDTGKTYTGEPALDVLDAADDATATFTVSAPAADLDAWLWHRPGFGEMSVDGDRNDFDQFAAVIAKGVD